MSLDDRLGLRVEVEFTPGVWTDIAADVLTRPVQVRRGRADWAGQVAPASLSIEINNASGDFTPGNRNSPYYPNVQRGVPIRVIITHDAVDYTRFTGEIASWRVTWPEGDVAAPAVAYDGVCRCEIEAGGVLRNMQRGPAKTPPVWTGGRDLFEVRSRRRVRIDPDWGFGEAAKLRETRPSWKTDIGSLNSFLFYLEPSWNFEAEEHLQVGTWVLGDGNTCSIDINHVAGVANGPEPPTLVSFYGPGGLLEVHDGAPFVNRWVWARLLVGASFLELELRTLDHSVSVVSAVSVPDIASLEFSAPFNNQLPNSTIRWHTWPVMDAMPLLQAVNGWPQESPEDRVVRIVAEAGFPAPAIDGESGVFMGPQQPGTVMSVLQECADVGGMLAEDAATGDLRFRAWSSLYNQPAIELDAAAGEIDVPLEVVLDDQNWVTQVTASNHDGTEVVVGPDTSPYLPEAITVNVVGHAQVGSHASWRLHLGTDDEPRSPSLSVDLGTSAELIPVVTALTEGDIVRISNLPAQWPVEALELMVQGAGESIESLDWVLQFNCTPGRVWTVGTLALDPPTPAPDYDARLDTSGCELAAGINATATSFDVDTTSGPPWVNSTDHADQFPVDVEIGGERMTVTAITVPTGTVQTFTVTRSVNGVTKSHLAGAAVTVAEPLILSI